MRSHDSVLCLDGVGKQVGAFEPRRVRPDGTGAIDTKIPTGYFRMEIALGEFEAENTPVDFLSPVLYTHLQTLFVSFRW